MTKRLIDLGLFQVTPKEAADCVKMLISDAKQVAGEFHGQNRSEKFRANWPDEYKFASANWKSFVEPMIVKYAEMLGDKKVSEDDKRRIYIARIMWEKMGEGKERDDRLQIAPNSQQFVGDPFENRKIKQTFGTHRNMRAALMNATATRH